MGVRATSPSRANLGLWVFALLGVLLLSIVPLSLLHSGRSAVPPAGDSVIPAGPRVAYLQFASAADTLWLADPIYPSQRQKLLSLPHASDFGVVPSLAPDGRSFVYTSLPSATKAPTPDTPAGLWLTSLDADATPRLIAEGVDLLVPARWSADGDSLVFRRSRAATQATPGQFHLVSLDLQTGVERELVSSAGGALFPVGFANDARFYFVKLGSAGSDLVAVDLASGAESHVARLGDGLTRDWALSPDRHQLAYLAMELTATTVSSRALVLVLNSGAIAPAGNLSGDAFGPVWTPIGELVIGQLTPDDGGARIAGLAEGGGVLLPSTARGFDVPLAFAPAGDRVLVRSFEGRSLTAPGRSVLAVLGLDGSRKTIATGEVTFLGWIDP